MCFVYVLKSIRHKWVYVGITFNLNKRLVLHNSGKVFSTKSRLPYKLVYYEIVDGIKSARIREKYFKNNAGKEYLKRKGVI